MFSRSGQGCDGPASYRHPSQRKACSLQFTLQLQNRSTALEKLAIGAGRTERGC
jgi:hypothetical protein